MASTFLAEDNGFTEANRVLGGTSLIILSGRENGNDVADNDGVTVNGVGARINAADCWSGCATDHR